MCRVLRHPHRHGGRYFIFPADDGEFVEHRQCIAGNRRRLSDKDAQGTRIEFTRDLPGSHRHLCRHIQIGTERLPVKTAAGMSHGVLLAEYQAANTGIITGAQRNRAGIIAL